MERLVPGPRRPTSPTANGTFAPKLLEEEYNLEDALLVGGFVNTLLRQAERVRVGCLAQIINVIAPLVTNEDGVLRQRIYYPYAWALKYARGRVLDLQVGVRDVPDQGRRAAAGFRPRRPGAVPRRRRHGRPARTAQACVLMLNRDLESERELIARLARRRPRTRVLACETLTGADLKAVNTFEQPKLVAPRALEPPPPGSPNDVQASTPLV